MKQNTTVDGSVSNRLIQLEASYRKYLLIMTGCQNPEPAMFVMACQNWRPKVREFAAAADRYGFNLLEMADIVASRLNTDILPACQSFRNPVNQAAGFLRASAGGQPPALIDYNGSSHVDAALKRADCDFFILLGTRLTELKNISSNEFELDQVKFFLRFCWAPCYFEHSFWPGLAYLSHSAKAQALSAMQLKGRPYDPEALRKTWLRLGLTPSKRSFIRKVSLVKGRIIFA